MDAIRGFFRKYNAVPATDAGPDWTGASDEALAGWAVGMCETWDGGERGGILRSRMADVADEAYRRMERIPEAERALWVDRENTPRPRYSLLLNAWDQTFRRIGYRWAVMTPRTPSSPA
jgi:hypothetical protein